jgi:hypothetical protein
MIDEVEYDLHVIRECGTILCESIFILRSSPEDRFNKRVNELEHHSNNIYHIIVSATDIFFIEINPIIVIVIHDGKHFS